MRIKVVTPNENGKIELTVKELQNLLNEAYQQGWNDKPYNSYGGTISYLTGASSAEKINTLDTSTTSAIINNLDKNTTTIY